MRKFLILFSSLFFSFNAFADTSFEPLLNTVTMQFKAEQWVATKTALVTVGVNASVTGSGLGKIQNDVLNKLNKLSSKGEWHIVSFNRSLDQSGLERVQMSAQSRLPSDELSGLRDRAKSMSVPGETYTLDNVEFVPSAEELRDANTALRNDIYNQAKTELDNLNKLYPDQKFYLHNANFYSDMNAQPKAMLMAVSGAAESANRPLAVGDKLKISATFIFASAPNSDVVKMVHN
jgi:hypothetical protein